ncbi:hypothetical protein MRS76_01485 [Rhizobiaceae bacterium n13]|uniref:Uncharacterized protein n=1 Tax=Ferirhizobium litorale TaxID=2927786 RepID=A0AAE3QCB9_9HYPH|nr:hypothetical protein [Fererhizobium litorale]MDI7860615.1 hypothetical protein [Fererhizobium litorale]MDI7920763.1 hypothetical protein [Fererhizobium litorale]
MKHHALEQLQKVAEVQQDYPRRTMSRRERLERWADVLERNPDQRLLTLYETEYQPAKARAAMRCDGSPLSVAFDDPVLRAAGLEGDSYGEAKSFFDLSDHQMHKIICYCHFGSSVSAGTAANAVRGVANGGLRGLADRLLGMFR